VPGRDPTSIAEVDEAIRIGPLKVRAAAADVNAFGDALGLPEALDSVPLTFPIRFLGLPAVRRAMAGIAGVSHARLLHCSQSFSYRRAVEIDRDYTLDIEIRRARSSADRIVICATLWDGADGVVVTAQTELRIGERPANSGVARVFVPASDGVIPDLCLGPIQMLQTQRYAAASLDDNPLHRDIAAAHALGLAGPIVPGMLIAGQFERAVLAWDANVRVNRLYVVFLRPLLIGSQVLLSLSQVSTRSASPAEPLILRALARTVACEPVAMGEIAATKPS
jgi:hypothetical protein